jgi:hypothetical protein
MSRLLRVLLPLLLISGSAAATYAQSLPTTQPTLLHIYREEVKIGHTADHQKVEMGWPAAFEKAKSPNYYLALVSMTGANEAWFLSPFDNHAALAEMYKREDQDPVLSAEIARLSRADAEHLTSLRQIQALARKDLSRGSFPDVAKQRYWEITLFRVRPGHERHFAEAAKVYGAAAGRSAPETNYRVYQVIAGMPEPTYLIISSVVSFADFDKLMAAGEGTMKGMTDQERTTLEKFTTEGLINSETFRFRLDPLMSYVSKEVRDSDPAFWMPKKPAAKPTAKPTTQD